MTRLCVDLNETKRIVEELMQEGKKVRIYRCHDLLFIRREKVRFIICYEE